MFVSGIKEQTEEELREYFGQYGNILNIQIVTDKETGQRKGFGFIEFDDSDAVDKAVCTLYLYSSISFLRIDFAHLVFL